MLGFDAPPAVVDELFDSWDGDGSGMIEFREFGKLLRPPSPKRPASGKPQRQARPAAGKPAAGKPADSTMPPPAPLPNPTNPEVREALEALRIVKAAQPPWILSPAPSWINM